MLYRVIDLGYSKLKSGIDDEPLKRLLHGHEVVSSTEHLYHHDGLPHLLVSVHYRLATLTHSQGPLQHESSRQGPQQGTPRQGRASRHDPASAGPPVSPRKETREDWREILREEDTPLFESLRAWRTQRARTEAVPLYVILTNAQLATVASSRPQNLADLKKIPGLGPSRLKRFGKEILGLLADAVVPGEGASGATESAVKEAAPA